MGSLPDAPARASKSSVILPHEAIEEGRKLRVGIERQDVGNILVRSHDDHAAAVSIDTAHIENVVAAFQIGTEHLLTSITLSMSAPFGVYFLTGDSCDRARKSQSKLMSERAAVGSSAPEKANTRQRPSALTVWPR